MALAILKESVQKGKNIKNVLWIVEFSKIVAIKPRSNIIFTSDLLVLIFKKDSGVDSFMSLQLT